MWQEGINGVVYSVVALNIRMGSALVKRKAKCGILNRNSVFAVVKYGYTIVWF